MHDGAMPTVFVNTVGIDNTSSFTEPGHGSINDRPDLVCISDRNVQYHDEFLEKLEQSGGTYGVHHWRMNTVKYSVGLCLQNIRLAKLIPYNTGPSDREQEMLEFDRMLVMNFIVEGRKVWPDQSSMHEKEWKVSSPWRLHNATLRNKFYFLCFSKNGKIHSLPRIPSSISALNANTSYWQI